MLHPDFPQNPCSTDLFRLMVVSMGFATAGKIILLLIWPFIFMLIFYFKDKEKFKEKAMKILRNE